MTLKVSSVKLFRESVKRRRSLAVLLIFVVTAYFPVGGLLWMINMDSSLQSGMMSREYYETLIAEMHYWNNNVFVFFLTAAVAILLAIFQFSYLHGENKVDFYHSIPVCREKLFAVQYGAGILIWLVPYMAGAGLFGMICEVKGMAVGNFWSMLGIGIMYHIAVFLLIYSIMTMIMMVTGKIFAAVVGFGIVCIYVPAICLLLEGMKSLFFTTSANMVTAEEDIWLKCSPVMAAVLAYEKAMKGILDPEFILIMVMAAVLFSLLAVCLYRKRNSESAGSAVAFRAFARIAKFLLVVPLALTTSLFFYAVTLGSTFAAVSGLVLGTVIFGAIIEFIYCMDIREVFRDKWQILLSLAVCGVIFAEFRLDLTGSDKWIPQKSEVDSAELSIYGVESLYMDRDCYEMFKSGENYWYEWSNSQSKEQLTTDRLDEVYELIEHSGQFERTEEPDENGHIRKQDINGIYYVDKDGNYYSNTLYVVWNMKDGSQKARRYSLSNANMEQWFAPFWEEGFKEMNYPILKVQPEDVVDVVILENNGAYYGGDYVNTESMELVSGLELAADQEVLDAQEMGSGGREGKLSAEESAEVAEALLEDLKAQEVQDILQPYNGYIIRVIYQEADHKFYGETFYLNDSYERTMEVLKKNKK